VWVVRVVIALLLVATAACGGDNDDVPVPEAPMMITLRSPAFADGDTIPRVYTCDGDDVSPPLEWTGVPPDADELAIIVEDPDAPGGTFVHWVLWGLDAGLSGLDQGDLPAGAREGRNDFGRAGWGGPCPPRGSDPHRYVFTLLALSDPLAVEAGVSADRVKRAAEGNVLAEGRLTGRYGR
jgi:Raf kinase inhibitor-like YbhB/YbcL family protein